MQKTKWNWKRCYWIIKIGIRIYNQLKQNVYEKFYICHEKKLKIIMNAYNTWNGIYTLLALPIILQHTTKIGYLIKYKSITVFLICVTWHLNHLASALNYSSHSIWENQHKKSQKVFIPCDTKSQYLFLLMYPMIIFNELIFVRFFFVEISLY